MTQQGMETIISELEAQFNQQASEKGTYSNSGLEFCRYKHTWGNDREQRYETYYGVSLWFNGVLVSTITKVDQWQAFKSVARLFCPEDRPLSEREQNILRKNLPENFETSVEN